MKEEWKPKIDRQDRCCTFCDSGAVGIKGGVPAWKGLGFRRLR